MTLRNVVKSLLVAMTIVCLGACSESYPGLDFDHTQGHDGITNQDSWSEKTPIMVFVNEQDIFTVKTRGLGAFDNNDTLNPIKLYNSTFQVFAFRDGYYTENSIDVLKEPTDFRYYTDSCKYDIPAGFGNFLDKDNATCLLDGRYYNQGLNLYLRAEGKGLLHTSKEGDEEPEFFYSSVHQKVPFNFFAYYLDDAVIDNSISSRTKDGIAYRIELDGTQDLMCGGSKSLSKAIAQAESNDEKDRDPSNIRGVWQTLNKEDKDIIRNIGGYCTYAAHRNIHPAIEMKHLLTQLTFHAYPGDETSNRIRITGVGVKSRYKGTLTVAARNTDEVGFTPDNDRRTLYLHERSDGQTKCPPLKEEGYNVPFDESMDKDWKKRPSVDIGSSLLLPPDSLYTLYIEYDEKIPTYEGEKEPPYIKMKPLEYVLRPTTGPIFEKGHIYPVNIVIYGSQDIKVYVSIEGWKEGDDIDLDDPEQ